MFSLIGVEWGLHFPSANGEYQSPINLNSREAEYDPSLLDAGLSPNYVVCRECEVINDGHTVRIILKSKSGNCHGHHVNVSLLIVSKGRRKQTVWFAFIHFSVFENKPAVMIHHTSCHIVAAHKWKSNGFTFLRFFKIFNLPTQSDEVQCTIYEQSWSLIFRCGVFYVVYEFYFYFSYIFIYCIKGTTYPIFYLGL